MPLPSRPGAAGDENKPVGTGINKPKLPLTPPSQISKSDSIPLVDATETETPVLPVKRLLGDEERYRVRKEFNEQEDGAYYQSLGNITSEEVITSSYVKSFKRLQPQVLEVKNWLQEYITQEDLTEKVGQARRERGPIFVEVKSKLDTLLLRYFAQNSLPQQDVSRVTSLVLNEILGFGPIEPLWQDSTISEIMINGPKKVYIERKGKLQLATGVQFRDSDHVLELAQQVLGSIGKTLDIAHPYEDGRLSDGSRINATHPIIGPAGPYLTIRRFPETVFSIRKLVDINSLTPDMAEEIGNLIYHKCSMIISGGTGSGKTSMLNALSGVVPRDERIITIEDNLELRLHPESHVVAMESRKALQADNKVGNITIRDLVRNSLRQRPDRIVVGEVRDGAAYDMLQAMNTGHEGSLTTIHSNSPRGAIERLSNLIAQIGELSANQSLSLISSGVDIIVQINRYEDGSRRVSSIAEIPSRVEADGNGTIGLEPRIIWEFQQTGMDENNLIIGDYTKVNEYSDEFIKQHRLDQKRRLELEEIMELSDWTGLEEDEED